LQDLLAALLAAPSAWANNANGKEPLAASSAWEAHANGKQQDLPKLKGTATPWKDVLRPIGSEHGLNW
jgi:hypothetical protein